jgi:hypothetical protein
MNMGGDLSPWMLVVEDFGQMIPAPSGWRVFRSLRWVLSLPIPILTSLFVMIRP